MLISQEKKIEKIKWKWKKKQSKKKTRRQKNMKTQQIKPDNEDLKTLNNICCKI